VREAIASRCAELLFLFLSENAFGFSSCYLSPTLFLLLVGLQKNLAAVLIVFGRSFYLLSYLVR
jgi:hypothetical protein